MERDPDPRADSPPAPAGRPVVAGLFTEREAAVAAIDDLKAAGFAPDDVGIAMRDQGQQGDLAEETGAKAAGGAAAGAVGGGLVGGALGLLVGLGALAIPGIGPVLAGGALATAFGLGGGTAVAGAGIGRRPAAWWGPWSGWASPRRRPSTSRRASTPGACWSPSTAATGPWTPWPSWSATAPTPGPRPDRV